MDPPTEAADRPARILYLITDLETGGVPLHLLRLAAHLDRDRFDPRVVCLGRSGPVSDMLERQGVPTCSCDADHALDFAALWRLRRLIRGFAPDLIHALLFHANIASRLVGPGAGVPPARIINEIQTVEIERRWHLMVDQLTCNRCRMEIGNSSAVVEHLCQVGGIPAEHLECIPGGVDPARFDGVTAKPRAEIGVPTSVPLIIWVGRMDPVKRVPDLIKALALIDSKPAPHLLLVGDGPERDRIVSHVARLGLDDRVHLLGTRSDIPELLAAADVFAFPSMTEGMPNALLEAMAARLAIVACDVPGCRDLARHDKEALLVPPASPECLARALQRLIVDPHLAGRLGAAARDRVLKSYSQSACHQRYTALYSRLLGDPNANRTFR